MLALIRSLRACRPICQLSDITERIANHMAGQQNDVKTHNLCRPIAVRPRRLFSSEDPNRDPLSDCDAIYPLNHAQIEELTGNDPEEIKKVRLLQMELAVKSVQSPSIMPKRISLEQWRILLSLSRSSQTKFLLTIRKKQAKQVFSENEDDGAAEYDTIDFEHRIFDHKLFRNSLFPMIHPNTIGTALNSRLMDAMLFNPPLIMDCGYEGVMTVREVKNLCQQLACCLNLNKTSRRPYNMMFCNLKRNSQMGEQLWSAIPTVYDSHVPILTYESCYTEMFPKERLVYLTPHCREPVEYNPMDIYIIGAMVDKTNPGPHSLIKAKSQGIRMGSFPIDKYLMWKQGTKSLTLDQVVSILVNMAETGDWAKSFKAVPKRKIVDVLPSRGLELKRRKFKF